MGSPSRARADSPMFIEVTWMCRPRSARWASALPGKGTWVRRVWVRRWNISIARWSSDPMPVVPTVTLLGLALAKAATSASV